MKVSGFLIHLGFTAVAGIFVVGCLPRPTTVSSRHFVLSPIRTNEPAVATMRPNSIGVGPVKMPSYLLRNSMLVRHGANEIEYLDDARWSERLDEGFQRTLAANLARLLPSGTTDRTNSSTGQMRVFVAVQQFDVDANGRGTLIAQWRITSSNGETSLKVSNSQLSHAGASPRGHPEAIASTMSQLLEAFSRELAESLRDSGKSAP
jgi:uncharacterized lipoprotein YmbA